MTPNPEHPMSLSTELLPPAAATAPPSTATAASPLGALDGRLTPEETGKVHELVEQLGSGSLESIHTFGRDLGQHTARYTDTLLEQVRAKDLDVIGARLSEIVVVARSLDLGGLSDKRSKVPLIGGLIDRVRKKSDEVAVRFQDVRTQVDSLVQQVQGMQGGLAQRVTTLETAFESVKQEHRLLGLHITAGEQALVQLNARLAMDSAMAQSDPVRAQEVQDLRSAIASLDKRVADMRMLQHAALQQLPMIRMVQANNRMLVEKFHTIRELTVPAWKRQFTLALSLNEQRSAVEMANAIDDATNEFLRENARLLKDNTIATARANQRMVIDVETLQAVHDTLMSTVQEVVRVNQEGLAQRDAATARLQGLRQQLVQQIGHA